MAWITGIQFFDKQVLHVRTRIGKAPGDAIRSTEYHRRNTWQGSANHIQTGSL